MERQKVVITDFEDTGITATAFLNDDGGVVLQIINCEGVMLDAASAENPKRKREASILDAYAQRHGIKPGKFFFAGNQYELTGYNSRAPKYPWKAKQVYTGKTYKFPTRTIVECLGA